MRKPFRSLVGLALAALLVIQPGCIIGSPIAAISGEPYGMTRDDVAVIDDGTGVIWRGYPVLAGIDIPFAFVLDTAFLPISLLIWGIREIASDDDDHDHEDEDEDEDEDEGEHDASDHSHGEDGDADHTHDEDADGDAGSDELADE